MDTLTEEQRHVFNSLVAGKNIFLTGGGGTGKSYLLSVINAELPRIKKSPADGALPLRIQTTALTGCAALLLGTHAKTVHSWAAIGLGKESVKDLVDRIRKKKMQKRWTQTDMLIIDEISMMTIELLEKLDQIGQILRKNTRPFGGIQLLFVGDFFQLPPVIRDSSDVEVAATPIFAFQSPRWASYIDEIIQLHEIHRQKDDTFRRILGEARAGKLSPESIAILETRRGLEWKTLRIKPTLLFPRKAEVDKINQANLAVLVGERHTYLAGLETGVFTVDDSGSSVMSIDGGLVGKSAAATASKYYWKYTKGTGGNNPKDPDLIRTIEIMDRDSSYTTELVLALNAQVMLIFNLDIAAGLVNGSRGIVIGFDKRSFPIVEFLNGIVRTIEPNRWEIVDYSDTHKKLYRTQIPLKLAYALTIHKSQGASLDSALIDIGRSTFEYGQAYVALSRVRSLDSLYIHAFDTRAVRAHPWVKAYYEGLESDEEVEAARTVDADPGMAAGAAAGGAGMAAPQPSAAGGCETKAGDPDASCGASEAEPWLLASIPPTWRPILKPYEENLKQLAAAIEGRTLPVYPPRESIWTALSLVEPAACKVIILGQDPYPTAGNAHGLAFSYKGSGTLPASLKNIYKEFAADLGCTAPTTGDLTAWAKQGVLLLNTILTVDEGKPLSHEKLGWGPVTDAILAAAAAAANPVVVLWGKSAQAKKKLVPASCRIIESPHPSPLAAHTGFFGSKPFSTINRHLVESGRKPIDWI